MPADAITSTVLDSSWSFCFPVLGAGRRRVWKCRERWEVDYYDDGDEGGDFNWIYRAEYCREVVQRHFVLYFRLIDSKLGVLIVVWGEKSRIWSLNLIHCQWSSSSSHLYLIKWSRMKLIVILFGWGNSSKIFWSASILAFSLELLNWLKVSKNCREKEKNEKPYECKFNM